MSVDLDKIAPFVGIVAKVEKLSRSRRGEVVQPPAAQCERFNLPYFLTFTSLPTVRIESGR